MTEAVAEAQDKVRVFVVDDSPLICKALQQILGEDPQFEVTGQSRNGQEALRMLPATPCDVCTLDVEMPGMSGLTVLKHIMIRHPRPTLMVSSLTAEGERVTFDALRYGAVDFFKKPTRDGGEDLAAQGALLRARIKRAAGVRVSAARYLRLKHIEGTKAAACAGGALRDGSASASEGLAVVVASTGGYAALLALLPNMTVGARVPIVISLAAPVAFLQAFVDYLQPHVPFPVQRAVHEDRLLSGWVYFVSNEESQSLERNGEGLRLLLGTGSAQPDGKMGSDLLLSSASERLGPRLLAAVLSGDGTEGRAGAAEVHRSGGTVVVQRPETCLAPGLPWQVQVDLNVRSYSVSDLAGLLPAWCAVGDAGQ